MKNLKKKLLFALVSELDFLKKNEGYEYKTYDFLYFRLSEYEKGSVRDAVIRLARAGLVDKITRGKRALFRITSSGREKLLENLAVYRGQKQVWDRTWRLVVVREAGGRSRELNNSLRRLGYRRISRGVYLTPLRVSGATKELFLKKEWQGKAQVIESRKLIVGDDLQLARNLWGLDKQADKYEQFVTKADRLLKMARRNIVLMQQSKGGFKGVFDSYFSCITSDKGLPRKLLPPDWQAEKAKELFLRLAVMAKTAKV